jgi:aminopeptidase N
VAATGDAGSTGAGDPYYPELGNGGFDVMHYDVTLTVDPATNQVNAETKLRARATEPLSSFSLDFGALTVDEVRVNGAPAQYRHDYLELFITPTSTLPAGQDFEVAVRYHGQPGLSPDVTTKPLVADIGWWHDKDGTINVISEPSGARSWFPGNDHPSDKATYRFDVTVPKPWIVAASGQLKEQTEVGDRTRYVYQMDSPMAMYLASIDIGKYEINRLEGPNGVLIRSYFPPDYLPGMRDHFKQLPQMMEYLETLFGPYPFKEYGVLIASHSFPLCSGYGTAAEIQTLTVHCPQPTMAADQVIVHELAHQWFGDSVSLKEWRDVWLKEGMATYAEWMWQTREKDAATLDEVVKVHLADYKPEAPVADPSPTQLYRREVYDGGAFVFHALRREIGDEPFFKILRTYLERYKGSSASTDDFIAVAQEVSGRDLRAQFDQWLYKVGAPTFQLLIEASARSLQFDNCLAHVLLSRHLRIVRVEFVRPCASRSAAISSFIIRARPDLPRAGWRWFAAEAMTPESSQE